MLNDTDKDRLKHISIDWLVRTGQLPERLQYWCRKAGAKKLYDLYVLYKLNYNFSNLAIISPKTVRELNSLCQQIEEQSWPLYSSNSQEIKEVKDKSVRVASSFVTPISVEQVDEWTSFFSNPQKVAVNINAITDYYTAMPEKTRDYLDNSYRELLRSHVRLFNILGRYGAIDFIKKFLTEPDEYLLKFRNIGKKTFEDYKATKQRYVLLLGKVFHDFYIETGGKPIIETTEKSGTMDKDNKLLDSAKITFGNVVDDFVKSFVLEHRHLPLFYLMHKYLSLSKKKAHNKDIIDSLYEQDFSIAEHSDKHNITRSAVGSTRKSLRNLLGKLVEPALIVVVGGMVAYVYIAFFMGMAAMNAAAR